MKTTKPPHPTPHPLTLHTCLSLIPLLLTAQNPTQTQPTPTTPPNTSLKKELAHAIDRGSHYLLQTQTNNGSWSDPDHPALTALPLIALQADPQEHHLPKKTPPLKKGYQYLLNSAQPNGGIYRIQSLLNYNTAISLLALTIPNNPTHRPTILKARQYLINSQQDFGKIGTIDKPLDGGIGYGDRYTHSDLSNTLQALEALYYSRHWTHNTETQNQLNWKAAISFIQNCQNLPKYNKQTWASDDPANHGGFIYFPGNSKAGKTTLPNNKTALRSYGSISYAGMLSYIYANMNPQDERIQAVKNWLQTNYTLDENPGMGPQGLYYYYYTMSKALTLANIQELTLTNGKKINWAKNLALKMLNLQQTNGSWFNNNARWWEKNPDLVTAYALLTLANIYRMI